MLPSDPSGSPLPGIGVRYGFSTVHGGRLSIIDRDDGSCEVYYFREDDDDEPRVVIRLDAEEARQAGAVMGGAYRRPAVVHELEIALGELLLEWVRVPGDSALVGQSIGEAQIRTRTGITVIAVVRGRSPATAVGPEDVVRSGDVLVTVGRFADHARFRDLFC